MQSHMKLSLCAFIFLCVIPYGLSIKCWSCRSNNDPKCLDPFDNTTVPITDCEREKGRSEVIGSSKCWKIKEKVNGEWQYFRGCMYPGEDNIQGSDGFKVYFICNDRDGCNTSSLFAPIPLLLVILVALPSTLF